MLLDNPRVEQQYFLWRCASDSFMLSSILEIRDSLLHWKGSFNRKIYLFYLLYQVNTYAGSDDSWKTTVHCNEAKCIQ